MVLTGYNYFNKYIMPTNKLPKRGIVDSLIYLNQQFERIKRQLCCSFQAGDTASIPTNPSLGQSYFDSTLGYPIWYNGTVWVDSTGTPV